MHLLSFSASNGLGISPVSGVWIATFSGEIIEAEKNLSSVADSGIFVFFSVMLVGCSRCQLS